MKSTLEVEWLNVEQAAGFLTMQGCQIAKSTLDAWRCNKSQKIPFYHVGRRVRYRKHDLLAWVQSNRVDPAFEEIAARSKRPPKVNTT